MRASRTLTLLSFAVAALVAGAAAPGPAVAHDAAAASQATLDRPAAARCAVPHLREALGEAAWAAPGEGVARGALPCDGTPVGPPPNPGIGDTWDWYIWRLNGFPQADLLPCTVRGMGPNCYVVVEDSQWNVNIDQAQVDTIVDHFENTSIGQFPGQGIWYLNTEHFGDPPDALDQDPRVYILYYDFDVSSDGFFWSFDQQCDNVAAFHSNECDVVYMNCSDFDPAGSYLLAVLAHEFEHLIHYNYDPNEASWVDEGMAELAMWLYGDPDNISQFNSNPDRELTSFSGAWYDYIKTYLFSLYFYERYGGQPSVKALIDEPLNSIAGYEAVLDLFRYEENFEDVFSDWVVANYLDDPSIGDGRFGYVGDNLPPFQPFATFSTYPVGPNITSVQHWAADYVRYLDGSDVTMTFDGTDANSYSVRALLLDPVAATEVVDMTLDGAEAGSLALPQFGTTHDEAVMVYASRSSTGALTYEYGAVAGQTGVPVVAGAGPVLTVRSSPSSRPELHLAVPADRAGEPVRLELFDVTGRRVRTLLEGSAGAGPRAVAWDGLDATGTPAAPGTYFARLTVHGVEAGAARVVLRR